MTPALLTELKRLGREAKAHPMSINLGCEYTDALMLRAPALLEAVETMHAALEYYGWKLVPDSLNKGRTEITTETGRTAREALARVAGLLGEGREK